MNVCMLALMVLVPTHSVPILGEPCVSSGYTRAWRQLLRPASIAKDDTRFGLRAGGPKNGLSGEETEWLSRVTGRVICPGNKTLSGELGSGALLGRNDQIITNSHVVRNIDGSKREDWPTCYFETQSNPPIRRKLKFFDSGTVFGTRKPEVEQDLDYALIRLEEPILGVQPIPIASDAGSVKPNDHFLLISAYQSRMKKGRELKANEPIIQNCYSRDVMPADERSGVAIYSNCSSTGGASGSILLKRDENNHLVGVGILARSGFDNLDHQEYGSDPDKGNHSFHLMFDGPLAKDLSRSLATQSGL